MKKTKPIRRKKQIVVNKEYIVLGIISAIIIIVLFFIFYNRSKDNSTFYVSKIITYNSADVISDSSNQYLTDLKICQFSDFCIYIENNIVDSKLTDSNTIKKLYIDNITISSESNFGNKILNYKTPASLGKYLDIQNPENGRIDFEIIRNNKQNNEIDYDMPTFYTDCSNPIFLGYINKNIINNYSVKNNDSKIYYNAKILKEANIDLNKINNSISFDIHITNNANKNFVCHINIIKPLDKEFLETGYSYIINTLPEDDYKFRRE